VIAYILFAIACSIIGGIAGHILKREYSPDNFYGDDYGWSTNQKSHRVIGHSGVVFTMAISYWTTGEYANAIYTGGCFLIGYFSFELFQRGKLSDMIEDTIFTVGYGAFPLLYASKWLEGSVATVDVVYLAISEVCYYAHLYYGIRKRKAQAERLKLHKE